MTREDLAQLEALVAEAPVSELPSIVGALVAAEERARLRLRTEPAPNGKHPGPGTDENLSAEETARRLGVSLPYLYKHADEYPFTRRIGRRVVFSSRELDAWNRGLRPGA